MTQIYALQGDTVDEICYRHYRRTEQVVERVYLANPGLAAVGVVLPHGYALVLPELPAPATGETLALWD